MSVIAAEPVASPPRPAGWWLRSWLYTLNVGLVLFAIALGSSTSDRLAVFLAVAVPVTFVPFAYARRRLHARLVAFLERRHHLASSVIALTVGGMLLDAVMAAQLLTARSAASIPYLQSATVAWVGPVWFSAHALLFLGYVLLGAARGIARVARWIRARVRPPIPPAEAAAGLVVNRRQFLQQLGIAGAGAPFIVSLSSIALSYDFRLEERELILPHWPKELDGLRVAHLSDIHVGGAMNRQRLLHVAAITSDARPDLVLHTGDFLTHRSGDFDTPLYEALARIRPSLGQWACLGNHDFDQPDRLVRRLRQAGVETLRGRTVTLPIAGHPLELAGMDFVFQRSDRAELYRRVVGGWPARADAARIVLNHDPSAFFSLPDDCADLVLSGHMHGGQIGIQLDSAHALTLVGLLGIPDQGVFSHGDMRMYVTRCVGFYGYPLRVGIPPEIALLTLRSA